MLRFIDVIIFNFYTNPFQSKDVYFADNHGFVLSARINKEDLIVEE